MAYLLLNDRRTDKDHVLGDILDVVDLEPAGRLCEDFTIRELPGSRADWLWLRQQHVDGEFQLASRRFRVDFRLALSDTERQALLERKTAHENRQAAYGVRASAIHTFTDTLYDPADPNLIIRRAQAIVDSVAPLVQAREAACYALRMASKTLDIKHVIDKSTGKAVDIDAIAAEEVSR